MAEKYGLKTPWENPDFTDSLGKIQIFLLFVSGIIWGFLAVNNIDTPDIFKISLVYSILLILGLVGVALDRGSKNSLGLDSVLWKTDQLQKQMIFAAIFSLLWYIFFMSGGLFLAVPLSVTSPTFAVSPTTKFFLVTVLGPIAENIFFFAVVNFSVKLFIRQILEDPDKKKAVIMGVLMFGSSTLFGTVPFSSAIITAAALILVVGRLSNQKQLYELISIVVTALYVGGVLFPVYHSKAYSLNEKNFIASIFFGIFMCLIASFIGLLVVDLVHIFNNTVALGV
jgi:hypothetical protein